MLSKKDQEELKFFLCNYTQGCSAMKHVISPSSTSIIFIGCVYTTLINSPKTTAFGGARMETGSFYQSRGCEFVIRRSCLFSNDNEGSESPQLLINPRDNQPRPRHGPAKPATGPTRVPVCGFRDQFSNLYAGEGSREQSAQV